ncbi:ecdysone 20-monooxygenase isoform X1 [Glossina fuscipes]|uniref:Ecdysone 20-monooxygenase isoform X1 n=1 Tax=Glossina fuscipes TaxID=7396 RepID=A0A8U0W6X7_9MUSC|nr:ecdysone 20-monooxygenase isoform X1 [Glossina fuscipes]XP_037880828.1 ecdysone 20-monooxygenase isoform X1 [Glossina fuscipes]XP_037880829.1 ecdysone 20-monooxygenase isoform X1 [Glossina fuscipes]XP_037880830.1 ecdysone 20-monooxygenase isoform X1 [Glossina fuscipes]
MAVILLMAIAVLLAFCCNFNLRNFNRNYIKPLMNETEKLTKYCNESEDPLNLEMDCYHARKIRLKCVWDIPGPKRLPFLGTKWIFMIYFWKYKLSKLHDVYKAVFLLDLNRIYGDIVLEVTPSGMPIVHLFNKSDLEKVLKYPSKYPFRPPTEIVVTYRRSKPDRYASVGIVNEQGPIWQKLRTSLTASITSPRVLQNFLPALNCVCDDFLDLLRNRRDPRTFEVNNFEDIANLLGLEAVCLLMLGRRMGFLSTKSEQPEKIRQLAAAVKQLFISQRDSYYGLGLWKYLPTKTYREFAKAEEVIYDVISEMMEQTLATSEANYHTMHHDDEDQDLRSIFLNILALEELDIRDKKSAIIDFIAAGIETLAHTLLFVLSSVTSDKQSIEKILQEFIDYRDSIILQDAFTRATYTKACIQEAYRIRPTAFCLARILEEDMQLSGYNLKAGTVVLCENMLACQKDNNFPAALNFQPERWIDKDGKFGVNIESANLVVPFGIGKRTCPGKRFVEMEIVLLLAKLILAFDISFVEPLETEFEFLLAPKAPLSLIIRDRVF